MSDSSYDFPTMSASQNAATLIMGPNQAGYLVQILLFGVFLQMLVSYALSGELGLHTRWAKVALLSSLVLNTVYSAICFQQAYVAGVSQDRTFDTLSNGDVWNLLPLLNGIISVVSEVFLAARAGALIQNRRVRLAFWAWIGALVVLVLVGSSFTCADGFLYTAGAEESDLIISYNGAQAMWMLSSAVADLSISLACAWSLRARIRGFNPETDTLLRHLSWIFLRTAAYTTILSLITAIILVTYGEYDLLSYLNNAFWTPGAALSALSLFTFSTATRRAVTNRLGSSGEMPGNVYINRAGISAAGGKVRSSIGPGIALQHLSGANAQPPVPLQITVQHQRSVHYEGPEDEDFSTKAGSKREKDARDFAV
ncbi:hypothetical protein JCM9279_007692 [Rhodotorula babjevae]